jgi:hypothetical protein
LASPADNVAPVIAVIVVLALLFFQKHFWMPLGEALTPVGLEPTLLREDRHRMTALYVVALVLFVLPTLVAGFAHAHRVNDGLTVDSIGRRGRVGRGLTIIAVSVQAAFAVTLLPGKRNRPSPVESWSRDDDMTIAASTVLEHAFIMGLAGCAAVLVAGLATTAWRSRHRAVFLACCYPVLLFLPGLLFHDGFLG